MEMKRLLPAACAISLACGVGIGWWAASSRLGNPPLEIAKTDSPRTSSRLRPDLAKEDARIVRLREIAEDPKRLETEWESLPSDEMPALIALLAARGGIAGLPGDERDQIKMLLKRQYEASPEDTIAWILATENPSNRRFYFEGVFECAAAKDPMQALEMAEEIRRETGDGISLPSDVISKIARIGADSLVRAEALTLGKADMRGGGRLIFLRTSISKRLPTDSPESTRRRIRMKTLGPTPATSSSRG